MKYLLIIIPLFLLFSCGDEAKKEVANENSQQSNSKAEITISNEQISELDITTATVNKNSHFQKIILRGIAENNVLNKYTISSGVSGIVAKIHKSEGDRVLIGEVVVELQSTDISNAINEYIVHKNEFELSEKQYQRVKSLANENINSQKSLEIALSEYINAKAGYANLKQNMLNIGFNEKEISDINNGIIPPSLKIRADKSGIVSKNYVGTGEAVTIYNPILEIVNEKTIYLKAFVPVEKEYLVSIGNDAEIQSNTNDFQNAKGKIIKIVPLLDNNSKNMVAIIECSPQNGFPRINQNVNVILESSVKVDAAEIPSNACVVIGKDKFVFAKNDDGSFEVVKIDILTRNNETSLISNQNLIGRQIATSELFTLKALFKYDDFAD